MLDFDFIGSFGNETPTVKVCQPTGAAGVFYLFINDYFQGQLLKRNGEWYGAFQDKASIFTQDDVREIGQLIDEKLKA